MGLEIAAALERGGHGSEEEYREVILECGGQARVTFWCEPASARKLRVDGHLFRERSDGPLAGVPYDGNDPRYSELYHEKHAIAKDPGDVSRVPESWKREYFLRLQDLGDQLEPDLMYHDGVIRFEKYGLSLVAHLYNQSAKRNGGKVEAVYACKGVEDCQVGTCVLDFERGIAEGIWPQPFETDTCIGGWHYDRNIRYKTTKEVVDLLVNVVSRNGTLLLNFPLRSDGTLDAREMAILTELTSWMAINGEGIFGTRAWNICGEGPSLAGTVRDTSVFRPRSPGSPIHHPARRALEGHGTAEAAADRAGCAVYTQGPDAICVCDGMAGKGNCDPGP